MITIPLLSSCQAFSNNFFKEVALYIGKTLINTVTGNAIEKILDDLLGKVSAKSSSSIPGYVIPNSSNSLEGRYSTTLKLIGEKITDGNKPKEKIELTIDTPVMVRRDKQSSEWELAPDLKQVVKQAFGRKFGEKAIDSPPENTSYGSVIPKSSDSLNGRYSNTMKISGIDKSGKKIEFFIYKPRMIRENKETQIWDLAPDLKQVLDQVIQKYE